MRLIELTGTLEFELPHISKKHERQSEWKRTAMALIGGDVCDYYAWFIRRRYHLTLYTPPRRAHITFIADRFSEMKGRNDQEREVLWRQFVQKYQGTTIHIMLDPDVRTNGEDWWLNVPEEHRRQMHEMRGELGLGRPHWGLHMTIGCPNDKNESHSRRLHRQLHEGLIP